MKTRSFVLKIKAVFSAKNKELIEVLEYIEKKYYHLSFGYKVERVGSRAIFYGNPVWVGWYDLETHKGNVNNEPDFDGCGLTTNHNFTIDDVRRRRSL